MSKKRNAQEYSKDEFDAVVALIQGDPDLRADIEAITKQPLDGKTPRELFDTFRAIKQATDLQAVVVRYGQARQAVRRTRAQVEFDVTADETKQLTAATIAELQERMDTIKQENAVLKQALRSERKAKVTPIAGRVVRGEVSA